MGPPNWYSGNIGINHSFFNRYGFGHFHGEKALGNSVWMHNPEHRLGVPYANREVAGRFAPNGAFSGGAAGRFGASTRNLSRREAAPQQRFGNPDFEQWAYTSNHSVFGGYQNGGMTRMQSDHGFSSMGAARTFGGGGGFAGGGGMRVGGGTAGGGGMRGGGGGGEEVTR
jgi:hypothetical protein